MASLDLRPLSVGEILDRTFSLYRRDFLLFIGISAIPHLLTLALSLIQLAFFQTPVVVSRRGHPQTVLLPSHGTALALVVGLLTVIVSIIVYLFTQGGTIFAVTELYLGRRTSISASLRRVWDDLGSLFGVIILNGLVTAAAFLALVIPGIYVACRLLVCVPAALIEGRGPRESLSRSWDLTREYAGRAFILYLLYFVLAIGMGLLIAVPIGIEMNAARENASMLRIWMAIQQVLGIVVNSVVGPFILIGTSVFYFDLRVRKEAFDLQFMMDPTSERIARSGGSVPSILS